MSEAKRPIYRCGVCHVKGHTRDTCPLARPYKRVPGWGGKNEDYAKNRALGACDACGRPSKKPFCRKCQRVRDSQPSRRPEYRRRYDKARRKRLGLKGNRRPK